MEGFNVEDLTLGEERRLKRAVQHVSQHWLPVNSAVTKQIQHNFGEGAYHQNPSLLYTDLKSDIGLFTHCFKALIQATPSLTKFSTNVLEVFSVTPTEALREIICGRPLPATHTIDRGDDHQLSQLRATSIVSSFVQVLSSSKGKDSEHGYSHAILKELGLNLIAWNYPTLFQKALQNLTPKTTLQQELQKSLGFSPEFLALCVLRPENLVSTVKDSAWNDFEALCEVGSALARANDPDTYPSASFDWEKARDFIKENLGDNGLKEIQAAVIKNTEAYSELAPEIFTPQNVLDPETHIESFKKRSKGRRNPYIKLCTPAVREKLKELYGTISNNRVSRNCIQKILYEIIPAAGFTGGAVYTLDPYTMKLVPRVKIGNVLLRGMYPVQWRTPLHTNPVLRDEIRTKPLIPTDLVTAAFECNSPLVEESKTTSNEDMIGLYGVIGKDRRVGVLYLEVGNGVDQKLLLITFKAIREALADSMHVSAET